VIKQLLDRNHSARTTRFTMVWLQDRVKGDDEVCYC